MNVGLDTCMMFNSHSHLCHICKVLSVTFSRYNIYAIINTPPPPLMRAKCVYTTEEKTTLSVKENNKNLVLNWLNIYIYI